MKPILLIAAALACGAHGLALAADKADDKLANDKQCFGCHALKEDGAAPSFQKIARFWKGRPDAETKLVATIRKGSGQTGGPHWNKAKMPDQAERPEVSEAEAKALVKWVLKQ